MTQLAVLSRHLRHAGLVGLLSFAGAVACSSDGGDPASPGPSTSGSSSGGSAGTSGSASGGAPGSAGVPSSGAGSAAGGTGAGGSASGSSGSGGGTTGGSASGGTSGAPSTGGSGGVGGAGGTSGSGGGGQPTGGTGGTPPMGTCPTALPQLAADNDTSFYANRDGIPHGAIKQVQYKAGVSKTMHVYTPPDYETNTAATYPVLYINHGGGEGDEHWGCTNANNCGYAGRILDNLLADGKAVPMIIAMPDTGDCANFNPPKPPAFDDPCTTQYVSDFIPYVEKTYRVKADRNFRAMAGLSMGGLVTLSSGFARLDLFSHVFVYSSGYIGEQRTAWQTNLKSRLDDAPGTNKLLNAPVYLAAGATDTALPNATAVRDIFKEKGIKVLWQDSSKGHEWANWRRYLAQTLPLMFKNTSGCQ